jgi:hypothetical protein
MAKFAFTARLADGSVVARLGDLVRQAPVNATKALDCGHITTGGNDE